MNFTFFFHELFNHGLFSATLKKSSHGCGEDSERITQLVAWGAGIKHLKFGIKIKAKHGVRQALFSIFSIG